MYNGIYYAVYLRLIVIFDGKPGGDGLGRPLTRRRTQLVARGKATAQHPVVATAARRRRRGRILCSLSLSARARHALLRYCAWHQGVGMLACCASAGLRAEPAALPSPLPSFTVLNFAAHAELADSRSTRCFLLLSRAAPSRP